MPNRGLKQTPRFVLLMVDVKPGGYPQLSQVFVLLYLWPWGEFRLAPGELLSNKDSISITGRHSRSHVCRKELTYVKGRCGLFVESKGIALGKVLWGLNKCPIRWGRQRGKQVDYTYVACKFWNIVKILSPFITYVFSISDRSACSPLMPYAICPNWVH